MANMNLLHSQKPVCAECGSTDIEAHAALKWSPIIQDWQITGIMETGNCNHCGNTTAKINWLSQTSR